MAQEIPDGLIRDYARKLETLLAGLVPKRPNEAEFRHPVDGLLDDFCAAAGLEPMAHLEYSLASGRADAVFNRFVIEYEKPGVLGAGLARRGTKHAVEQVDRYIKEVAKRHRQQDGRIAGIAFDGVCLVFLRYREGDVAKEPPVTVNRAALERFLRWLASLALGVALTPEYLNADFAIEQPRTQNALRALTQGLDEALARGSDGMVAKLFEQWRLFFSESIDYSEAFGGRKLDPLKKWVRKAGIEVRDAAEAERFFFALHTYFLHT